MAQFLGDVAWMLELFAIAGGLILLHHAAANAPAQLLRLAGWILIAGGISAAACTGYYWFRYQADGHFDAPRAHGMMTTNSPTATVKHGHDPE